MKNNNKTTVKDETYINKLSNICNKLIMWDNAVYANEYEDLIFTTPQISIEKQNEIINILINATKEDTDSIQFIKNKGDSEKLTYMAILSLTKKHLPPLKSIFPNLLEEEIKSIQQLIKEDAISPKNDAKEFDENQQQEITKLFEQKTEVEDEEYQKKQKRKEAKKQRSKEL